MHQKKHEPVYRCQSDNQKDSTDIIKVAKKPGTQKLLDDSKNDELTMDLMFKLPMDQVKVMP